MIKRTENIIKMMQANDDHIASLTSSANLMIQKKHYASQQIHDVVNRMQIARTNVLEVCLSWFVGQRIPIAISSNKFLMYIRPAESR